MRMTVMRSELELCGNRVENFTVLLCTIFMHVFYCIMKGIKQFAANLLRYILPNIIKTGQLSYCENQRVNFFETQCICAHFRSNIFLNVLIDL